MAAQSPLAVLKKTLASGWPSMVLIAGEDQSRREQLVEELIAHLPEQDRLTGIDRFESVPLARALDAARTPSLLGGHRLVIASQLEGFGAKASDDARAALESFLKRLNPCATLVVLTQKVDKRLAVTKLITKHGLVLDCPPPKDREMPAWIAAQAKHRGMKLGAPVAQAIADAVGTDTGLAMRELDKLQLVTPEGKPIALELVEALLRPGRTVGAFVLEDALLAADRRQALVALDRSLQRLRAAGEALPLLARLAGISRRLVVASEVLRQGQGEGAVQQALGCHPFVAKKYAQAARRGSAAERGSRALSACVSADGRIKSGHDARAALRDVVMAMTGAPQRGMARLR